MVTSIEVNTTFDAKQFIKNKKMFLKKLLNFVRSNPAENFDNNPYLNQLNELLSFYTKDSIVFDEIACVDITCDKKLLKGFKAFADDMDGGSLMHNHYFLEFYEKYGHPLIDKILLYWMVDLQLNPKQCKEYADLFCQHFNKFSHRPLQSVPAQVKYKELLDSVFYQYEDSYDYSGSSC